MKDMFEIAGVQTTLIGIARELCNVLIWSPETTYFQHCLEYVKEMDLSECDGIVCISGDGLLHEVFNALMAREDAQTAINIPIGVIPGGSGNGLANSFGLKDPIDAAFCIIKGKA